MLLQHYGLPVIVALNRFGSDTEREFEMIRKHLGEQGVEALVCEHFANGSKSSTNLAKSMAKFIDEKPGSLRRRRRALDEDRQKGSKRTASAICRSASRRRSTRSRPIRSFGIEIEQCARCGGGGKVIASIEERRHAAFFGGGMLTQKQAVETQKQAVKVRVLARRGAKVKQIARELGISKNTVKRYLRDPQTGDTSRVRHDTILWRDVWRTMTQMMILPRR